MPLGATIQPISLGHGDGGPAAMMRRFLLMLTAVMLVLGAFMTSPDRASAAVEDPALAASVTADATLERTYSWSIDKVADAPVRSTPDLSTSFRYTVTARAGGVSESGWALRGAVTVVSTSPRPTIADVEVASTVGGGSTCVVSGGDDVVVPASGRVALPYTCTFTSAPAGTGTVTATVAWDPEGQAATTSVEASAPVGFTIASETDRTVAVVDDQGVPGQRVVLDPELGWAPGLVRSYSYDLRVGGAAVPGTCVDHTSTAAIDLASGADPSASVTVRVCAPEVLPVQAFGRVSGSVTAGCRGMVRVRLSNRTAELATYRLRIGDRTRRITVRSLSQKKIVTQGRALSTVTLKVGTTQLDRIRIPQRCEAPVVLPDTGLRAASS